MKIFQWKDKIVIFDLELCSFIHTTGWTLQNNSKGIFVVVCKRGSYRGRILSRVLMNAPKHLQVDHINGNPLDNRLENLRLVTPQQNNMNSKVYTGRKYDLPKGVTYRKDSGKYRAQIRCNYTKYSLGQYDTVEEAEAAYKKAAEKYFGNHATHLSRKE